MKKTILLLLISVVVIKGFAQGSACEHYAYEVVYVKGDFAPKNHRTYVENLNNKKYPKSDYLALKGGFQKMSMFCLSPSASFNSSSNGAWFSIEILKYTDCINRTESMDDDESNGKYHFSIFSCTSVDNKEYEYVSWSDRFLIIYETKKHQMTIYHYMEPEEISAAGDELLKEAAKPKNRIDTTYDESGKRKTLTPYVDGKKNGIAKEYDENGKLRMEKPFANDQTNGIIKTYYENGKLKTEIPCTNGKLSGIGKGYYESGKLKTETPCADGEVTGIVKVYYESGKLNIEVPHTNGKKNGIAKEYYENGKLKAEHPYTDGKKNGSEKMYNENGQLEKTTKYVNGVEVE